MFLIYIYIYIEREREEILSLSLSLSIYLSIYLSLYIYIYMYIYIYITHTRGRLCSLFEPTSPKRLRRGANRIPGGDAGVRLGLVDGFMTHDTTYANPQTKESAN